jgi:hypothetical protein
LSSNSELPQQVGGLLLRRVAQLVGAWRHGFVSMKLAGAFRLGGELAT